MQIKRWRWASRDRSTPLYAALRRSPHTLTFFSDHLAELQIGARPMDSSIAASVLVDDGSLAKDRKSVV